MKRKMQILTISLFCAFIGFFHVANILNPDHDFSQNENRVLMKFPKFSTKSLFYEQYTTKFETYFTDQFVGRDIWIPIKALSEIAMGKMQNNGVYFGKDHYLIPHLDSYKESQLNTNIEAINQFVASKDTKIDFMLVPSANQILKNKLSNFSYDIDQLDVIEKVKNKIHSKINFVQLAQTLDAHKEEDIYFKTDHHWNALGAFYGYQAYQESLNQPLKQLSDYKVIVEAEGFKGTQYSKAGAFWNQGDPILRYSYLHEETKQVEYEQNGKIHDDIYSYDQLKTKDKYTFYLDGNHSITTIQTNKTDKENLLIIKDSYAHIFTPFLVSDYNEITMVDLRYYKAHLSELIKEKKIDRVLFLYSVDNFVQDGNFIFLK